MSLQVAVNSKSINAEISPEEGLLQAFAVDPASSLSRKTKTIGGLIFFEFTASCEIEDGEVVAGFGQSTTEREALLKAIAELYERLAVKRYFKHLREGAIQTNVPPVYEHSTLRSSNGWAVHFSREQAKAAATNEALERHILLISFLKDGWKGFIKIDERVVDGIKFTSLISRYQCNNLRAGMVIAKSPRQPGVTFGYFSESMETIKTSPRWTHALFEAKCQLDGFADLDSSQFNDFNVVELAILDYLKTPWVEPEFSIEHEPIALPDVKPSIQYFDLSQGFGVPLWAANISGGGLFPLFFARTVSDSAKNFILPILSQNGVHAKWPERIPIL